MVTLTVWVLGMVVEVVVDVVVVVVLVVVVVVVVTIWGATAGMMITMTLSAANSTKLSTMTTVVQELAKARVADGGSFSCCNVRAVSGVVMSAPSEYLILSIGSCDGPEDGSDTSRASCTYMSSG
mmetsp:Transcript_53102/g.154516  ORF Transcript_53102/g.154516 Transcript_53102/m.154516 type:complete len:125 (+) Transcript_53102:1526-1900(+)